MKTKLVLIFSLFAVVGCAPQIQYVPVESTRLEYRDRFFRDSVYFRDSIIVKSMGDTVYMEQFRYVYKDRFVRDTLFRQDTLRVAYPVDVVREVNRLSGFQNFQVWLGRIFLFLIVLFFGIKYLKRKVIK